MKRFMVWCLAIAGNILLFCHCKNYIGNPHATVTPPRVVPALNGGPQITPAQWWVGRKNNRVELLVQKTGVAAYSVRLGKSSGVKLVKTEKGDSLDCLLLTLAISAKAKPQKVALVFKQGLHVFTCEYPLLAPPPQTAPLTN